MAFPGCGKKDVRILCVGDSLTAGYPTCVGNGFPEVLAQRTGLAFVNAGQPGETAFALARRLAALDLRSYTHVLIESGANDFLLGTVASECSKSLDTCVEILKSNGLKVCVLSFCPPGGENAGIAEGSGTRLDEYRTMYSNLATKQGLLMMPDIWAGDFSDRSLKADDFHPNGVGYGRMGRRIA